MPLPGTGAIVSARSLDGVDGVLGRLRWSCSCCASAGTGLAAAVSRVFARRVMAPVADLTAAADHIEATGDLHRRIAGAGEDELGRLARRFNAMLDRLGASQTALSASLESQRQLIADASHELRTPVTSLRTNVEVLRDAPDAGRRRARRAARRRRRPGRGADELVADIIVLARGGDAAAPVEEVRLDDLVAEAVDARAPARAGRRVRDASWSRASSRRAASGSARAVNNLLDNAAKYSPPGGGVEVVRRAAASSRCATTGPGVAAADAAARLRPLLPRRRGARPARLGPRAGDRAPGRRGARRHGRGRGRPRRRRAVPAHAAVAPRRRGARRSRRRPARGNRG